jgi:hypothetical protein
MKNSKRRSLVAPALFNRPIVGRRAGIVLRPIRSKTATAVNTPKIPTPFPTEFVPYVPGTAKWWCVSCYNDKHKCEMRSGKQAFCSCRRPYCGDPKRKVRRATVS